jgi:hypothetical protein
LSTTKHREAGIFAERKRDEQIFSQENIGHAIRLNVTEVSFVCDKKDLHVI